MNASRNKLLFNYFAEDDVRAFGLICLFISLPLLLLAIGFGGPNFYRSALASFFVGLPLLLFVYALFLTIFPGVTNFRVELSLDSQEILRTDWLTCQRISADKVLEVIVTHTQGAYLGRGRRADSYWTVWLGTRTGTTLMALASDESEASRIASSISQYLGRPVRFSESFESIGVREFWNKGSIFGFTTR